MSGTTVKSQNIRRRGLYGVLFLTLFIMAGFQPARAATRVWDGGGATGNWSDAANWSGNVAPGSGDEAVFDGTSAKNAVVDTAFSIGTLSIGSNYAGTIAQSANLTVIGPFTQAGGAFAGGAASLNISSFNLSGGVFSGGTGLITGGFGATITQAGGTFSAAGDVEITTFSLSGGTFNAPAGTMTVAADWTHTAGGVFNAGAGTVKLTGYQTFNCANQIVVNVAETEIFNNLTIANSFCNARSIAAGDTLIVGGDLRLAYARIGGGRIRPLGTTTIDATNVGYTGSTVVEYVTPGVNFTIDNPSSTAEMLPVEMNAAGSTLTSTGAGKLNFFGMTLTAGTLNQGAAVWDFSAYPGYTQSGGAFHGSAAELNISSGAATGHVLTGGVFEGGTGLISGSFSQAGGTFSTGGDMLASLFVLAGGTFNAPAGTLSVGGFTHTAGGVFNAGTGTVQTSLVPGTYGIALDVAGSETFYNLKFNGTYNSANHVIAVGDEFVVNGALTFSGRGVSGGSIVANGPVVYENYGAYRNATTLVKFQDTATRTVTLCGDTATCNGTYQTEAQPMLVNNPNITINTGLTASGAMTFPALTLQQGTFNQNDGRVDTGVYNQSGGVYNGGTFSQSFGSLNSFTSFTLSGGDFNAAPSMSLTGDFTHSAAGGNFNEGTGTVFFYSTFYGVNGTVDVNGAETFYNVAFYSGNGTNIAAGDRLIVNGTTTLRSGTLNGGTLEARGNVDVLRANVGGSFQGGSTDVVFSGAADQTFSNPDAFASFGGSWTIDKPNAPAAAEKMFAPAAPSTLFLSGAVGRGLAGSYPAFSVAAGNVVQTGAFDHYFGSLSLAAGTNFVNEYAGSITLAGNVRNDGSIRLNANGAGCQADSIALRSTSSTRREWTGGGTFQLVDVDVSGQAGTPVITVYSGTDSGNNGANWLFDASCLAPTAANVTISGRVRNAKGAGIANVRVVLTDAEGNSRVAVTSSFGTYKFGEVLAGQVVTVSVSARKFVFASPARVLNVADDLGDVDFTAEER